MPTSVNYSGGNLFRIALEQLGDATQWWRIAQANGLTDFMLSGNGTLTIPDPDTSFNGLGLPPQ